MENILYIRQKPSYEFTKWNLKKRELARFALQVPESHELLLEWIEKGDAAPSYGDRLFDFLYPRLTGLTHLHTNDNKWLFVDVSTHENVTTWTECIIQNDPLFPAWSRIPKITTVDGIHYSYYDTYENLIGYK